MEGWIKLHRAIQNNDIWSSETFSRGQAWVDLLILANHKESFFYKRGNKVIVKRGQVGRSEVELSDRWKWSRTKVRKFLKDLEKEQQIEILKSRITQVLTIVNYDVYQEKEQQTEQQKNNRRTTEEQQKDIYKNEKKEEEGNNKYKYIPFYLEVANFFKEHTGKNIAIKEKPELAITQSKYKILVKRIKEGATVEQCKAVIKLKTAEWKNDNKMKKYLDFDTLFNKTKFEKYLDELNDPTPAKPPTAPQTTIEQYYKTVRKFEDSKIQFIARKGWLSQFEKKYKETFGQLSQWKNEFNNATIDEAFLFDICYGLFGRLFHTDDPLLRLDAFRRSIYLKQSDYNRNRGDFNKFCEAFKAQKNY